MAKVDQEPRAEGRTPADAAGAQEVVLRQSLFPDVTGGLCRQDRLRAPAFLHLRRTAFSGNMPFLPVVYGQVIR